MNDLNAIVACDLTGKIHFFHVTFDLILEKTNL